MVPSGRIVVRSFTNAIRAQHIVRPAVGVVSGEGVSVNHELTRESETPQRPVTRYSVGRLLRGERIVLDNGTVIAAEKQRGRLVVRIEASAISQTSRRNCDH